MMIQISLGLFSGIGQAKAQTPPSPGTAYTAGVAEFSRDMTVFDSGAARGLAAADVPLTGTTNAPDGTAIEARAVSLDDGGAATTAWTVIGTASGGAYAGLMSAPRAATWFRAEVRVQGSSGGSAQMANRFGVGHVWAIWEQSNGSRLVTPGAAVQPPGDPLYDPLTHENDVQILCRASAIDGTGYRVPVFVNEANKGSAPVTPTAVSMANAFSAMCPGEKLVLIFNTVQGTHPKGALTTVAEANSGNYDPASLPDRDWDDDALLTDSATLDGAKPGAAFVPGWIEAAIANGPGIPELHYRLMVGKNLDASAVTIGVRNSGADFELPRLHATTQGGKYDFSYTRMGYFGPHESTKRMNQIPDAAQISTLDDLPGYDGTGDRDYNMMMANAAAIFDSSIRPEVMDYPGVTHGAFRDGSDNVHFSGSDRDGRQRLGLIWMYYMGQMTGLHSHPVPRLDSRWDEPGGTFADFWIAGNNSLTTERLRRAAAGTLGSIPATIPAIAPHRTEVMGWSVNRQPAMDAQIVTVSAADVAAGHPAPQGSTVCRVFPNAGTFSWTDEIVYGMGNHPEMQIDEDYDDRSYLNLLVADMGQPAAMLEALPVQTQGGAGLSSTLAAPTLFAVDGAHYRNNTGTRFNSYQTAYLTFSGRIDVLGNSTLNLMGMGGDAFVVVGTDGSLQLKDGTNTAALPAGTITPGVFSEYHFRVNRGAGNEELAILDAGGNVLASATTRTGNFANGRVDFCSKSGGGTPITATVSHMEMYFGQLDDTGTPNYAMTAASASPWVTLTGPGLALNSGPAATAGSV